MKLLSICIPSYNRFDILQENLDSIFLAKSNDFEVVVVDNCSPVDICSAIKCEDNRLRIVKRDVPVYGAKNVGTCCGYAEGKFALLCLDKDFIDGTQLDKFIEVLRNHKDVCGGYCDFNLAIDHKVTVTEVRENAILQFGYLLKHPSGDFYRSDIIRSFIDSEEDKTLSDAFVFDIEIAACAVNGPMLRYGGALVYTARPKGSNLGKTLSFLKRKGTLFFHYENRLQQFNDYTSHCSRIVKNDDLYGKMLLRMYRVTVNNVTFGYNAVVSDKTARYHYEVDDEPLSFIGMVDNLYSLDKILLNDDRIGLWKKIGICVYGKVYFFYVPLRRIAGKIYRKLRGK